MKRAVIYARYSTDLQSDRSIADQVEVCRAFCARNGWHVVEVYTDRAQSGASMIGRDGLMALVEAGKRRAFDIVVAEHGDRLSRITEELDGIRRRMNFANIIIHTVNAGIIDETQAAIQGLMGSLFLRELANKVRRGLQGVVRDGRHAGGRPYGYRAVPGEPGRLMIVEEEAEVVRRIFQEYVEGRPPRTIAHGLNVDGIAPPRGRQWNASTINGNASRGHGMIFNEIYAGQIVWNRVRMIKDPDTGKRISRPNPQTEWQRVAAPELRIVEEGLYEAARTLKDERAQEPRGTRRPVHLLSGLLRCGCCGSGYSVHDRDKTGKTRIRCSAVRESGICTNRRVVYLEVVERSTLTGLVDLLDSPHLMDEYLEVYNSRRVTLASAGPQERAKLVAQRDVADAELKRVQRALIRGLLDEAEAEVEIVRLRRELQAIDRQLDLIGHEAQLITVKVRTLAYYRRNADGLIRVMDGHIQAGANRIEASQALRDLIKTVTIHPSGPRASFDIEVEGRLDELIREDVVRRSGRCGVDLVAREGFEPPTQGL
ncbi:recombinase family protein [Methylobacterium fujisawaense]